MGKDELKSKISDFVEKNWPFTEECQVVYLMVEMRKILDHERDDGDDNTRSVLRFFCDWVLHTDKSRITPYMDWRVRGMYEKARKEISEGSRAIGSTGTASDFVYFDELRVAMGRFYDNHGCPEVMSDDATNEHWHAFISLLTSILVDQPIIIPSDSRKKNFINVNVDEVRFEPAAHGAVSLKIKFRVPIFGSEFYQLSNFY